MEITKKITYEVPRTNYNMVDVLFPPFQKAGFFRNNVGVGNWGTVQFYGAYPKPLS